MKYTNQVNVENLLQRSLTAQEIALLPSYIESVSQLITNYTNRQWADVDTTGTPENETKYYDTDNGHSVFTDDFSNPTSIILIDCYGNERELVATDYYQLYPLNKDIKNEIRLCSYMFFRKRRPGIKITAMFSIALPDTVEVVATQLVTAKIQTAYSLAQSRGLLSENIEGYSYRVNSQGENAAYEENILSTLDGFRKPLL